jgi:predicted ArsR family transcriptional regulator
MADIRWTRQTRALLAALLPGGGAGDGWRHGYDLSRETGLKSGTLYPLLIRLTERGWLETRWEDSPEPGRPPRHLYRLTAEGKARAATAGQGGGKAPALARLGLAR